MASKITTLDKTHFTEVERIGILLKNRRTSAAASAAASLAGVKGPDDLPLRPEASGGDLPFFVVVGCFEGGFSSNSHAVVCLNTCRGNAT